MSYLCDCGKTFDCPLSRTVCISGHGQRITELEKEIGFWMGEGQDKRPEIVEYRVLALKGQRTPEESRRLSAIAKQLRIENESCPELKQRITKIEQENHTLKGRIENQASYVESLQEMLELKRKRVRILEKENQAVE